MGYVLPLRSATGGAEGEGWLSEAWEFKRTGNETRVTRSFRLHAKSLLARLFLWVISFFLKRAIVRHLREMRIREEVDRSTVSK